MTTSAITAGSACTNGPGSAATRGDSPISDRTGQYQAQHVVRATVIEALGFSNSVHGVRGIAHAIRNALAGADPNAPDPVPGMLQAINDALDSAAQKLADQGVDQATIDATISRFRSDLAAALDAQAPTASDAPAATQPGSAVAAHDAVKEKASLKILTAEGDQVSIRFRIKDSATAAATSAHVISGGRLKIEVAGNLSDAELTAIGDLLDKVDAIATQFFGGDVQAAFAAASRLSSDPSLIAGFDLRLTYSRSLGIAASGTAAPAPAIPPADSTTTSPAPTPTQPPAAQQTITSFIKDVLAQLASVSDAGTVRFTMGWKVDFLLTALSTLAPPQDATPAAGASALSDSLHGAVA